MYETNATSKPEGTQMTGEHYLIYINREPAYENGHLLIWENEGYLIAFSEAMEKGQALQLLHPDDEVWVVLDDGEDLVVSSGFEMVAESVEVNLKFNFRHKTWVDNSAKKDTEA